MHLVSKFIRSSFDQQLTNKNSRKRYTKCEISSLNAAYLPVRTSHLGRAIHRCQQFPMTTQKHARLISIKVDRTYLKWRQFPPVDHIIFHVDNKNALQQHSFSFFLYSCKKKQSVSINTRATEGAHLKRLGQ